MKILQRFESLIDPFKSHPDKAPPKTLFAFYWHYISQIKWVFVALLVTGFFVSTLEIFLFKYIGEIVDLVDSVHTPAELWEKHHWTFILMLSVILLFRPLASFLHNLLINQSLTTNFTSMIRWQQHRYVVKQSLNFFHSSLSGGIASRVMNTGQSIRNSVIMSTDSMWRIVIYAVTTIILFFEMNPWLALPILIWILLYTLILRYFLPRTRHRSHISAKARSRLMGHIVDSYSNITTLKLFSHSEKDENDAKSVMQKQTDAALRSTQLSTMMDLTLMILNSLLIATTIILSVYLWGASLITAGAIAFTMSLVIRINTMSSWVMRVISHIFEDIGNVQDGIKVIAQSREVQDHPNAGMLENVKGEITFRNVSFNYHKEKPIYQNLNLMIHPGEKIGLVGPSGAGKTTLTQILLRLYDIDAGEILIDGENICHFTQDSLRQKIGVVTQEPTLFHRSIRDNLLYGNPDATDEMLYEALRKTHADQFVRELIDQYGQKGLDALVGESGVKLSGGQRQRIAIARVLLKNAPILILDEATSALDSESESVIQENLEQLMAGKTVIAIAHRLSTIAKMDRLIVMENGKIIEQGTHNALLAKGGLYASFWEMQAGKMKEDETEK
ncbi:multidrug ABC transporter ATP-binding protein [Ignatzschineria sp. F8392]|uniref:ABC transporter ATP-binding protein n=1 Tax=Ignatzschineria sp. F8392 TaxID=1980117 RepID=UPI000B996466|nr:ABC transporter ATP-binding protein [Ignatzschineria sp. F8392]OYQ78724.1 multidrug ABC transporter ATP-binding protein [Ignatzschineria sp. F8392]